MAGAGQSQNPESGRTVRDTLARKLIHNSNTNRRRWSVINSLVEIYIVYKKTMAKGETKIIEELFEKCSTRFILSHRESLSERNCLSAFLLFAQLILVQRE